LRLAGHANGADHVAQYGQRVTQQRRFVVVARGRNEWRDHVAAAIAEGDHLVAFLVSVPAVPQVVAALLRGSARAVAVNDREVQELVLMKPPMYSS